MAGLLILLAFLFFGHLMADFFSLPVPAAILGMLLLLAGLLIMRRVPAPLARITESLSPWLPLFLTPVSVGIITHEALLREQGVMLLLILAISLIPGILVCGLIMSWGQKP